MTVPILHVISKLPIGGVERQLVNILENYDRDKLLPYVCSLTDSGVLGRKIRDIGVEVIELNSLTHSYNWDNIKKIRNIIREKGIKILRSHQYHANLYGRIAAKLENVPCIVPSVHNLYTRDKKIHRRIINNILSNFSHKIVAVSNAVKQDIVKYDGINPDKIAVIHNGINLIEYCKIDNENLRSKFNIDYNTVIVGNVARLSKQKGQIHIIRAIPNVINKYGKIKFMFVGDGELRRDLENLAVSLKINNYIIFIGFRNDIREILNIIDIFVFPSLWEGFANSILEAMATEKPIIASDIQPIREIINHSENGILIRTNSSEDISKAIIYLIENRHVMSRIAKNARTTVEKGFDIKVTAQKYTSLFFDILNYT